MKNNLSFRLLIVLLSLQFVSYSQITITSQWIYGGCSGPCSGGATFSVTGGTAPYTYTFSPTVPVSTNPSGDISMYSLCTGSYTVMVADQNSVTATYTFSIVQSPALSAVISTTNSNCTSPCGGVIDLSGVGGIPPYSYQFSGVPNPSMVNMPMTDLCTGLYSFYVYDSNGCGRPYTVQLMPNTTIPGINASLNVVNSTCINSFDGVVSVSLSGSNPGPYTYLWSPNGQTTQSINANPGTYMVTVYDAAMNCMSLVNTVHSVNGYCGQISGNIYIDNNSDCIKNTGDINCQTAGVIANPGNRIGYTNLQGNYYIPNLPYGTYTVTPDNYANSVLGTCSTSLVVNVNGSNPYSSGHDFSVGYTSLAQPDIQVAAYTNGIVPGFNCYINYSLCNLNNVPASGVYKAIMPSGFIPNITSITPATYVISGDTIIWNYNNIMNSGSCQNFRINFVSPVSTPLGSIFTTCMIATTSITDFDITNNTLCYDRIVTGAFDPNEKCVSPLGVGSNGYISTDDKELTYLIRFQNTGNGPAQRVVVSDSISSFLDLTTFQMLSSSHDYDIAMTRGNVINWTFSNIMLPDSTSDEPNSHGYIHFRIKQKTNNPVGSQIKNTAYIYFDFNNPVITNTTLNTIQAVTLVNEKMENTDNLFVYPNPSMGKIKIIHDLKNKNNLTLKITDALGKEVLNMNYKEEIDISSLEKGIYFLSIYGNGTLLSTKKIVKE